MMVNIYYANVLDGLPSLRKYQIICRMTVSMNHANMGYISETGTKEIIQLFEEMKALLLATEQKKNQEN